MIFFGRNVTYKVSNLTTLYYATCITYASAILGKTGKHEDCIFHSNAVLPEFNQSLLDFFNPFDLQLVLTLLYDSLSRVINECVHLGAVGGMVREKGSRELYNSWTVLRA